jgi:beta-N-acetylglucosaminidase
VVSGQASATSGDVVAVEVYLDGRYAPTVLTDANTPAVAYACTIDPATLDSGLHRVEAVAFGDNGSRRRIGGAWFTATSLAASAALDGLSSDDVLSSDRTVTARLVVADTPVSAIEVRVDGVTRQTLEVSPATRRPTLAFPLERSGLGTGRHTITLVAVDARGGSSVALEADFSVPRGGGALDQPADEALSGSATLSGYVLHGSEFASVEAYLSGTSLAETLLWSGVPTRDRTEAALGADVLAAAPKGFAFTLDTGLYPDGAYTLTIRAVPLAGTAVQVETRTVFIDNLNGVVNGDGVNVRNLPTTLSSSILVKLPLGTVVDILDAVVGNEAISGKGTTWYRIRFTYNGVLYGTGDSPCYIYGYYLASDPAMREGSLSSVAFEGMATYTAFDYARVEYSAVVPHESDRISLAHLYRYPGTGRPTLFVDGTAAADLAADVLLAPGSHVLELVTPANGGAPGRTYTFRVLRVAEQVGTTNGSPTNLRATATSAGTLVMALAKGVPVLVKATVKGQSTTSGGTTTDLWHLVRYPYVENGVSKSVEGYVHSPLVTLADSTGDTAFYLSLAAFPTSYHAALWDTHIRHPLWNLEPLLTGLSWTAVLNAEAQPGARRNLTPWYSTKSSDFYSRVAPDYDAAGTSPTYIGGGYKVYDSPNWVAASQKMVAYYLDPRNFLDDRQLFQFEQLSYAPSLHTLSGVEDILAGVRLGNTATNPETGRPYNTFVYPGTDGSGNPVERTMTYAQAFLEAGVLSGVSPYHLASKSRMEVSTSAASGMIASALGTLGIGLTGLDNYYVCYHGDLHDEGTALAPVSIQNPAFPDDPSKTIRVHYYAGFFNFYNIGAYPNPSVDYGAMKNGIRYAQWGVDASYETLSVFESDTLLMPWSDPYRAIVGGAKYLAANYIGVGQDTMYLEKFDLIGPSYYNHQFVQNVQAARDEGVKYYDAYEDIGSLESSFVFRIPVFNDMPATTSPKPQ